MGVPNVDVMLVGLLVFVVVSSSAMSLDLPSLLRSRQQHQLQQLQHLHGQRHLGGPQDKRGGGGSEEHESAGDYLGDNNDANNPCKSPEAPFPCRKAAKCTPVSFLCDGTTDCPDGYDEDEELCTAKHRPPIEDIQTFLKNQKDWIYRTLFANRKMGEVAHALVVSTDLDDFRHRLDLSPRDVDVLREAFQAVGNMDEETLEDLGMPPSAWNEVNFIFGQLIRSGFDISH